MEQNIAQSDWQQFCHILHLQDQHQGQRDPVLLPHSFINRAEAAEN